MLSQHCVNVATSSILRILSVSFQVALFNVVDCQSGAIWPISNCCNAVFSTTQNGA